MADEDQQLEALAETFPPGVELDPELARYRFEYEEWPVIKHPLVFDVPYMGERMNKVLNERLAQKRRMLADAEAESNWHRYVFAHERPYRLDGFRQVADRLSDPVYWELLGSIWTDSENIHEAESAWMVCLLANRKGRGRMMDDDERKALAAMPSTLTIYRGFYMPGRESGLSWTLDRPKARWFATRLAPPYAPTRVAKATVKKADVIAYFTGRGESEIVVTPDKIKLASIKEVR